MPTALKMSIMLQATNTWFQKAFTSLPYTQNLQDYLKQLNLQEMALPEFHIPENLFLKRYF